MTNDERSRLVAEAMGLQECPTFAGKNPLWLNLRRHFGECTPPPNDILGSQCLTPIVGRPFDLADARDREAVIAWLVEQGFRVVIEYNQTGVLVVLDDCILRANPTIEEAFGQAVLAAIGGDQ